MHPYMSYIIRYPPIPLNIPYIQLVLWGGVSDEQGMPLLSGSVRYFHFPLHDGPHEHGISARRPGKAWVLKNARLFDPKEFDRKLSIGIVMLVYQGVTESHILVIYVSIVCLGFL